MQKDNTKFKLNEREHEYIYNLIKRFLLEGKHPVETPTAIILGGQPGSCKSLLINKNKEDFNDNNVIIINGDEFRRFHSRSDEILKDYEEDYAFYTDVDVRVWTSKFLDYAIEHKYNVIFEGTLRTNAICSTLERIKNKGYIVKICALSVHHLDSLLSTKERFETQKNIEGHGRISPLSSQDESYTGMIDTLEEIENGSNFDSIEIFTKDLKLVYFNDNTKKKIYSKYSKDLRESINLSREDQNPSLEEIDLRFKEIYKAQNDRECGKCGKLVLNNGLMDTDVSIEILAEMLSDTLKKLDVEKNSIAKNELELKLEKLSKMRDELYSRNNEIVKFVNENYGKLLKNKR